MIKFIKYLYGLSPYPEVIVRMMYYSSETLQKIHRNYRKLAGTDKYKLYDKKILLSQINRMNLREGDLVIVHSSMDSLSRFSISPSEVIDYLLSIIGKTGTLVMPVFPIYKKSVNDDDMIYDVRQRVCSTGMLPNIFLRYPNVVKSLYPHCSVAAVGPLANEMMKNNLNSDLAFGKDSSWYFCKQRGAKVLFLGVASSNTTTIVHVAEDVLDDEWPIQNWYLVKKYTVVDKDCEIKVTVRVRDQFWSRYNASIYRTHCFKNKGLLKEWDCMGINFGVIDNSSNLIDYIICEAKEGRLYFKVPFKHHKKTK